MTEQIETRSVKGYGWLPDLPDRRDRLFSPSLMLDQLPQLIDYRSNMPDLYDQLVLGSCTANAIGAAIEFEVRKQGEPDFMPSRLFIYWGERSIEGSIGYDSGAMIRDGFKFVNQFGVCPEDEWPYDISQFTVRPPDNCWTDANQHLVLQYSSVLQNLDQMRGCLASGYPFVFGFTVYESFESREVAETGQMPMPAASEQQLGGHAVLAVGYDDSTQTFIVRNSWGKDWGDGGYFHMPFSYITNPNLCDDFWAVRLVQ